MVWIISKFLSAPMAWECSLLGKGEGRGSTDGVQQAGDSAAMGGLLLGQLGIGRLQSLFRRLSRGANGRGLWKRPPGVGQSSRCWQPWGLGLVGSRSRALWTQ